MRSDNATMPQLSGGCLLALSDEDYQSVSSDAQYMGELKRLMRCVLSFHLGNKKLKSRELFRPVSKAISNDSFS